MSGGFYCEKVSEGCRHCYASAGHEKTFGVEYPWEPVERQHQPEMVLEQKVFERVYNETRGPTTFAWCLMTDFFGEWVPVEWRERCLEVMKATPQHTHLLLTKRPTTAFVELACCTPENVSLGVSVENDEHTYRIKAAYYSSAKNMFLMLEPLLGPVDLTAWSDYLGKVRFASIGLEWGRGDRECKKQWVTSLIGQLRDFGIPYYLKRNLFQKMT